MNGKTGSLKESLIRQPLYLQVEDKIRRQLLFGMKPGDRVNTEAELARLFDVSIVTVRGALSELVQKGLIEKRRGSGTYVSKPRTETQHIAIWIEGDPALGGFSPLYFHALQALRRAIANLGHTSRPYFGFVPPRQDPGEITCTDLLDDLRLNRLKAVISLHGRPHPSWLNEVSQAGIPLISLGSPDSPWNTVNYDRHAVVCSDYEAGLDLALKELKARGRKRLAVVGWDNWYSDRQPLVEKLQRFLPRWGFQFDPAMIQLRSHGSEKGIGWQSIREIWIPSEIKPDALLITDDTLFPGCIQALNELKVGIPADLDVALVTSDWFQEDVEFPLIKVGFEIDAMVKIVSHLLEQFEQGKKSPKYNFYPATFLPTSTLPWVEHQSDRKDQTSGEVNLGSAMEDSSLRRG